MTIYGNRFRRDVVEGLAYKYWWEILPKITRCRQKGRQRPWGYEHLGRS
ncbi:MAG: hypothetical protein QM392_05500 [Bacillota bacterium]|jgi:hypothetical protein|nr:hypothetical protein [Bacillota bacterium]